MSDYAYLTHYIKQSCGWVKIADYACANALELENMKRALRGEASKDEVRLEVRKPRGQA